MLSAYVTYTLCFTYFIIKKLHYLLFIALFSLLFPSWFNCPRICCFFYTPFPLRFTHFHVTCLFLSRDSFSIFDNTWTAFSHESFFTLARACLHDFTCWDAFSHVRDPVRSACDVSVNACWLCRRASCRVAEVEPAPHRDLFQKRTSFNFPPDSLSLCVCVCPPPPAPRPPYPEPATHLDQCSMKRCAHLKAIASLLSLSCSKTVFHRRGAPDWPRCRLGAGLWLNIKDARGSQNGMFRPRFPFASDSTDECR